MSRSLRRALALALSLCTVTAVGPVIALAEEGNRNSGENELGALGRIKHIVVIYEENHSFDNLYGGWEGVNGLARANAAHTTQLAQDGTRYTCLAQNDVNLAAASSCFANAPFKIDAYIHPTDTTCPLLGKEFSKATGWLNGTGTVGGCTRDIVHRFYQEQYQLNGGRQNLYVTGSDAVGLTMGYYDTKALPIYKYLHSEDHPSYAISDNFFQAAFGGSFLNHQWLIAAATPVDTDPANTIATLHLNSITDANGMPNNYQLYHALGTVRDGPLTEACPSTVQGRPCGNYAVNTMQPSVQPRSSFGAVLPTLHGTTIGDRLNAAGVDWAWYAGGWSNAAGLQDAPGWTNGAGPTKCLDPRASTSSAFPLCPDTTFQTHHQPFNYYANYQSGPLRAAHLQDEEAFLRLARSSGEEQCNLKPVSFVKPLGLENEHPGYTNVSQGSNHLVQLLQLIENSACAEDTMVVVTYDEFGGSWDHVTPPGQGRKNGPHDAWGPGTRIPALIVAPRLRDDFVVDHTQYDTTSILATIEHRFGLKALGTRDAAVKDLSFVFNAHSPFEESGSD